MRISVIGSRFDIVEERLCTRIPNGSGDDVTSEARHKDFVARPNSCRTQDCIERYTPLDEGENLP